MIKKRTHTHPNPIRYRIQQSAFVLLLAMLLLISVALLGLALYLAAFWVGVMAVLVLLLAAPVVMALRTTPAVTLEEDGLRLQPFWGREQRIRWDDIAAIRLYPLLPKQNNEVLRRVLVGRERYQEAEGIMLIVPDLPFPYRVAGMFAGAGGQPVLALTTRTHEGYDALRQSVYQYAAHALDDQLRVSDSLRKEK